MINRVILALVMALVWVGAASAQEDLSWLQVTPRCAPGGLAVTFAARGSAWNSNLPRDIVVRAYDWQTHTAGAQIAGPAPIDEDGVTVFAPLRGADWIIFQFTDTGTVFGGFRLAEFGCPPPPPYLPHGEATLAECALLNVDIALRPDLAGVEYHVLDASGQVIVSNTIGVYGGDLSFIIVPDAYMDIALYRLETAAGEFLYSVARQNTATDETPRCELVEVGAVPLRWK